MCWWPWLHQAATGEAVAATSNPAASGGRKPARRAAPENPSTSNLGGGFGGVISSINGQSRELTGRDCGRSVYPLRRGFGREFFARSEYTRRRLAASCPFLCRSNKDRTRGLRHPT